MTPITSVALRLADLTGEWKRVGSKSQAHRLWRWTLPHAERRTIRTLIATGAVEVSSYMRLQRTILIARKV